MAVPRGRSPVVARVPGGDGEVPVAGCRGPWAVENNWWPMNGGGGVTHRSLDAQRCLATVPRSFCMSGLHFDPSLEKKIGAFLQIDRFCSSGCDSWAPRSWTGAFR